VIGGAGDRFGHAAGDTASERSPDGAVALWRRTRAQPATERRERSGAGLGGSSRRRSLLGLVRPDHDRQASSIVCAGGQRNVSRQVEEGGATTGTETVAPTPNVR
jgi:hypothetical protein